MLCFVMNILLLLFVIHMKMPDINETYQVIKDMLPNCTLINDRSIHLLVSQVLNQ